MVLFNTLVVEDDIEWQLDRLKREMIINPSTDCWEWQGAKINGYGTLSVGNRIYSAHRLMWKCVRGEFSGLHVLHKCDNPCCINPDHLWLGTNADNVQDKVDKGRSGYKLNPKAVRDIRTSKLSVRELAEKYGISTRHIYHILNRKTWKHVK
jgi:hypothetical protein